MHQLLRELAAKLDRAVFSGKVRNVCGTDLSGSVRERVPNPDAGAMLSFDLDMLKLILCV